MAFGEYGLCRYPIDWDTEHHRHLLPNTREISLAARDSNDRFPDIRRQEVPGRDQLAQGKISAGSMQTGGSGLDASAMQNNILRNLGRGCNSRRVHDRMLVIRLAPARSGTSHHRTQMPARVSNRSLVTL